MTPPTELHWTVLVHGNFLLAEVVNSPVCEFRDFSTMYSYVWLEQLNQYYRQVSNFTGNKLKVGSDTVIPSYGNIKFGRKTNQVLRINITSHELGNYPVLHCV